MAVRICKGRDIVKEIQQGLVIELMRNMEMGGGRSFLLLFFNLEGYAPSHLLVTP